MNLPEAILAAMPGSMKQVAARIGIGGPLLWDTAKAMREAGILKRGGVGSDGKLQYAVGDKPLPDGWEPHAPPPPAEPGPDGAAAPQTAEERRKSKKWPVVICRIDGWPGHDPGRALVWEISYRGERRANEQARRLGRILKGEATFAVEFMTRQEAWRLRAKGFSMKLFKEQQRKLRMKAAGR